MCIVRLCFPFREHDGGSSTNPELHFWKPDVYPEGNVYLRALQASHQKALFLMLVPSYLFIVLTAVHGQTHCQQSERFWDCYNPKPNKYKIQISFYLTRWVPHVGTWMKPATWGADSGAATALGMGEAQCGGPHPSSRAGLRTGSWFSLMFALQW